MAHGCVAVVCVGLALASSALAQPAATDLGRFDNVASRSLVTNNIVIDAATPVRWFTITVPRIADPHRFLDIWTQYLVVSDTEIALYSSTGTLLASDDDDGAETHSALSFGITNPGAPSRQPPGAFVGQNAGVANNGRDGTISGPTPLGPTVATYYIAVTQYDATFANNFSVTRTTPVTTLVTDLVVRMNTPGGQITQTAPGQDFEASTFESTLVVNQPAVPGASVTLDCSAAGGPGAITMLFDDEDFGWYFQVPDMPAAGVFPVVFRATNALGDVGVTPRTMVVRPAGYNCITAFHQPLPGSLGTTIVTYSTTLALAEGPWGGCSPFNPTGNVLWFRFVPTASGRLTLSTCNADTGVVGPQPDTLLGLRRFCFDPTFITCADDTSGCGVGTRLVDLPIQAGQEYNIAVRAYTGDIANGKLLVQFRDQCDSIDFNNDTLTPDSGDLDDFVGVLAGGPSACSTFPTPGCNDIDFNNDGFSPDSGDLDAFLSRLSGGPCL